MSEKRKDNKGRILRTGESQRKDLIYQYRYTDIRGKRQTVYSSDLKELREKEKEIQKQLDDGIDYAAGKITVIQLLKRYISIKQGVRYNTKVGYNFVLNLVKKEDFGYRSIRDIKVSDAQKWIMKLHEDGKRYSGFLLLDKNDSPKVALYIENEMRWAMKKYQKLHPDKPLPHITPHVFRHTFCTNMANAGMDIKTLQYVMGHSDVGVTLNVYTHASYDRAAEQMAKIIDFKELATPEPQKKSG